MERARVLASITLSSFVMPYLGNAINVAALAMSLSLGVPVASVGFLQLLLTLATASAVVPLGRLADVSGRPKVYRAGLALMALASALALLPLSYFAMALILAVLGIGAAAVYGSNYAILVSAYPPGERGRAIGINTLAVYIGLTSGPVIGGILASANWRYIFLISLLFSASSLVMALDVGGDRAAREPFDAVGAVLFSIGMLFSMLGTAVSPFIGLLGLALLATFGAYEATRPIPLIDPRLFKRLRFTAAVLASLLNYMATFAVTFMLGLYLEKLRGLPSSYAGILLLPQPAMMAALSPLSGWLSDLVEPGVISSAGMALATVALAAMSTLGPSTSLSTLEIELALLGVGFALFISPNTNIIMSSAEPRHRGVASAVVATARLVGQSLSMAIAVYILSHEGGFGAVQTSMAIYSIISLIASILSLLRISGPRTFKRGRR